MRELTTASPLNAPLLIHTATYSDNAVACSSEGGDVITSLGASAGPGFRIKNNFKGARCVAGKGRGKAPAPMSLGSACAVGVL